MPEIHLNPKKNNVIKNEPKGSKAKLLFDQKAGVLMTRIQVLEKENAEFIRLLKKEKQLKLEKAQFLSNVSHDCRSPLTSIQLSASLIERYFDRLDREKLFGHLDKIKLSVVELTGKLNELIEV
jgi:signal transduction histidine kinase